MPAKTKTLRRQPENTRTQLSSLIKSARDIMRKDAGLNGDLDRLPQLSWMLFLKCYDDLEKRREGLAVLAGKAYKPVIPAPYRWRDWASDPDKGSTGAGVDRFRQQRPAARLARPDRQRREADHRGAVRETYNRMLSGYLLRDVVNLVDGIHFQVEGRDFHAVASVRSRCSRRCATRRATRASSTRRARWSN